MLAMNAVARQGQDIPTKERMNISITTTPTFRFGITRPVLDVLIKLSESHYDSSCKLLYARAGHRQVNGLLRIGDDALRLALEERRVTATLHATTRDLDLLLKCMEMTHWLPAVEKRIVDVLRKDFLAVLRLANTKHTEWGAEYITSNSVEPST